ncbi:hypothetical protein E3N88_03667 [Mikania micrantha]|uniref:Reverse transcriptase Ty1/copia-type domain-containing protein n=1 Tax=Mikania micrantha TaxID=192012 RepID=A0A5N6Q9I3_9ASTR|nr:hypothetical protein E3N88_03667 [Mikania micrantha]
MTTRSMAGIFKPKQPLNLHTATSIIPLPNTPHAALNKPDWNNAMLDEFRALIANKTWVLVPKSPEMNIVCIMWIFKHKKHAYDILERYKARLVCDGRSQQVGVDCDETFSPVVKPATIRTFLSIAQAHSWPIHHLDVKNAFLDLHQPFGFRESRFPDYVLLLRTMLQWEEQLRSEAGFQESKRANVSQFGEIAVVCWPDGEIVRLRSGSTAADAATRVGLEGKLVSVNGQVVLPNTQLKDGDVIQVRVR